MREGTIFQLALKPKDFPAGMRLRNLEWGVLFAIDGTTPIGQIRRTFGISEEELEQICDQLLGNGLIREKPVSLSEYMAAQTAASGKKTLTLLELLQGGTAIRALTMEAGKGAPVQNQAPLNSGLGTPGAVQVAKITPPPVPPEALAGYSGDRGGTGTAPVAADGPGVSSPSAPLLPPVGTNGVSQGPLGGPTMGSTVQPLTSAFTLPVAHKPSATGAAAVTMGRVTPLLAALSSTTGSGAIAAARAAAPTETDTTDATASIIHPGPVNEGRFGTDRMPSADLSLAEPTPTRQTPASPEAAPAAPPGLISLPSPAGNSRRRLSLKNVIEFIITRVDDLNAGQLDVYRVFIRVNTRLLKRNGVHSLRFEEDRVITDLELQEAILASVERTLGVACPPSVFL